MKLAEWRTRIGEIAAELCSPDLGAIELQNRLELGLSRLWRAMQDPPGLVRSAYEALDEDDLDCAASDRAADLANATPAAWAPEVGGALMPLVRLVAIETRALDKALHEARESARSDDPNLDFLAFGGEGVFIIPRIAGSAQKGRRGQAFERRGLTHHRILPTEIGDLVVRLHSPAVRGPGADGSPAELVSAMFAKAELDLGFGAGQATFRVTGAKNEGDLAKAVAGQLAELAVDEPCLAVVWPELTGTPGLRDQISEWLEGQGLSDRPAAMGFAVLGSWHVARDGSFVNSAEVMEPTGALLFEVLKRERFQLKVKQADRSVKMAMEQIEPGHELPILLYGEMLIAFGICKDFCEGRHATPYPKLDVDLVIVPSLGDGTTIDEHIVAADRLGLVHGTRAFVVQQYMDEGDGGELWGVVLRPPVEPRGKRGPPAAQRNLLERTRISCTIT